MGRKVSDGLSIKMTVPENTTIEQGKFYVLDGFLGMAVQSVTTGPGQTSQVVLNIEEAEYETSQINATDAFNKGDRVYWDATNKVFTTSDGAGSNRLVGIVTEPKDANNVIWFKLGPQV
jgi:predicted RecA/RadA family phage recombinase